MGQYMEKTKKKPKVIKKTIPTVRDVIPSRISVENFNELSKREQFLAVLRTTPVDELLEAYREIGIEIHSEYQ